MVRGSLADSCGERTLDRPLEYSKVGERPPFSEVEERKSLGLVKEADTGMDLAVKVGEYVCTFFKFSVPRALWVGDRAPFLGGDRAPFLGALGGKDRLGSLGCKRGDTTVFL